MPVLLWHRKYGNGTNIQIFLKTFPFLLNETKQDSRSLKWEQNSLPSLQKEQVNLKALPSTILWFKSVDRGKIQPFRRKLLLCYGLCWFSQQALVEKGQNICSHGVISVSGRGEQEGWEGQKRDWTAEREAIDCDYHFAWSKSTHLVMLHWKLTLKLSIISPFGAVSFFLGNKVVSTSYNGKKWIN